MKMSKKNSKCNEDEEKIKEKHEESIDSAIDPEMEGDNTVEADGEAMKINSFVILSFSGESLMENWLSSKPENDIFPGRYRMESSEKFDDFMKVLGVGIMRRKLANSVVPINEIEITPDGEYIIRTLTTVRNTEIR